MKMKIYLIGLSLTVMILLSCFGQTELYYSTTGNYSVLSDPNIDEIEFHKTGIIQQSQLTGQWQAENIAMNTYSQLRFTENGIFIEEIYSNLSSEKLASLEGNYQIKNEKLLITFNNGDQYNFHYELLSASLLKLHPVTIPQ